MMNSMRVILRGIFFFTLLVLLRAYEARAQIASQCGSTEPKFVFGAEIPSEQRDMIRKAIKAGVDYVCQKTGIGVESLNIFAFADLDKLSETYAQWFNMPLEQARDPWRRGNSAISGPKVMFFYTASAWFASAFADSDFRSLVELSGHEYFHVVQWKLTGQNLIGRPDNEIPLGGPRWLIEGAATFVGSLAVDDLGLYSFGADKEEKSGAATATSVPLSNLETLAGLSAAGEAGSKIGFMACDLLTPSDFRPAGVKSLTTFWESIGNGSTWQDAFEKEFGISIANFYQRFEQNRARLFPPTITQPFAIIFEGTFPPGTKLTQDAPLDQVPNLFRVTGFDIESLTSAQIDSAFKRPPNTIWSGTKLGRNLLVLYMQTDTQSGNYNVTFDLPDGRHAGTTFRHVATTGSGIINPVPFISTLTPSRYSAGNAGFILTISGSDFVNGAVAQLDGATHPTRLRNSSQLEVAISGRDVAVAGNVKVSVSNPSPNGGTSNAQTLMVTQFVGGPRVTSASVSGKKLFVFGAGFSDGAVILVNGQDQTTTNDLQTPHEKLISKKGGKKIKSGQLVTIQIRNADGVVSSAFSFTRP